MASSNYPATSGAISLAAVGSAPAAEGASASGSTLTLQPADATHPGVVTTAAQSFAGTKTFSNDVLPVSDAALNLGTTAKRWIGYLYQLACNNLNDSATFSRITFTPNGKNLYGDKSSDGSTAIAHDFQTGATLANAAALLARWCNSTTEKLAVLIDGSLRLGGTGGPTVRYGAGTPEAAVTAPVGSLYLRTDGGAGTSHYVKESGTGSSGWVAK